MTLSLHALSAHTRTLDVTKPHFPTAGHTTAARDHTLLSSNDLGYCYYPHMIFFHLIQNLKPMIIIHQVQACTGKLFPFCETITSHEKITALYTKQQT